MIYVPNPSLPRRVLLDGEDITRLCFWADTDSGEACLFVEKDGRQQTREVKGTGTMLVTERRRGRVEVVE